MDIENMNVWYWLIPLTIGIVCGLLGYNWGRGSAKDIDHPTELKSLRDKNSRLQSDLDACNKKQTIKPSGTVSGATEVGNTISSTLGASLGAAAGIGSVNASEPRPSAPTMVAFDAAAAKAAFGKEVTKDNLKLIEGIGPKIEELFQAAGIKTWKALSESSVASCKEILNRGGERYQIHDPASWPMQAKMCYEGKWKELVRWQEDHDDGKL